MAIAAATVDPAGAEHEHAQKRLKKTRRDLLGEQGTQILLRRETSSPAAERGPVRRASLEHPTSAQTQTPRGRPPRDAAGDDVTVPVIVRFQPDTAPTPSGERRQAARLQRP